MKNKIIGDKFCGTCGKEKHPIDTGRFYVDTGNKIFEYTCQTQKCEMSCLENGGHIYKERGNFFCPKPDICLKCGHEFLGSTA